ncbi:MAG: hypothetical protein KDJ65_21430 [Anaerolineae bacterium]|nr:hypothetical protein [Anaerolineae bacterium]
MRNAAETNHSIKKLRLEETVLFAINTIPQVDTLTLKRFLELVNAGGTFGSITHDQIVRKMHLVLKYVPDASVSSLLIVLDLLDMAIPYQLAASIPPEGDEHAHGTVVALFTGLRQSVPTP